MIDDIVTLSCEVHIYNHDFEVREVKGRGELAIVLDVNFSDCSASCGRGGFCKVCFFDGTTTSLCCDEYEETL